MADNDIKQIIEAFRELDINTGNGLIGESRLFEPSKRAIFIGIGGTGNYALRKLKRIVYQRYKNIGERFGFIGVDTDLRQEKPHKDYMLLDSDEQFPLEAEKFFFDPAKYHLLPDYIREWLNEDISFTVTGEGAGGFRAAARALLFHSADEFLRKLQNVSNRIRRGDLQANVDVFILAGVGGGTGSGTMLDIAYIVRKVLSDVKKRIHGFIFMPDINLSETLPQATRSYIAPNAFAALKEIDYWMNIRSRSDVFRQKYSASLDIEDYNPPFDYCWPITATNTNGVYVSDALKQSATVAAETICAWISYRDEKDITGAGQDTFITSFASNIEKMTKIYVKNLNAKSPGRTYPVSFGYTVCGASVAKLPVAAINTYLACILFKRFNDIYNKSFDEKIGEDLSSFCNDATVGISPDKLKSALETEFNMLGVRQPKLSEKKWEELFENDADRPLEYYLNQVAEKTAEVQMKVISSKKEVLSAKLKEMFIDETKGPYYLNSFIQNGNSGLIFLLDGYVNSLMTEKSNLQQREQEMARRKAEAYKNGKNAIFFMRGSHVTEYSGAIKRFYDVKKDQLLCDAAIGVYKELQQILAKRVSASYNASYALLDALSKTFRNNIEAFKSKVNVEKKGNYTEYSWDIFTLPEIVELVTDTLAQKGINEQKQTEILKSMLYEFLQIIDKEIGRNSAIGDLNSAPLQKLDVGGFLADFVSRHFKELTDKTMKQYMEMKAGEEGLNAYLVRQFQRMEQESAPLFFSQPDKAYTLYYGTIPMDDSDIKAAWTEYAVGNPNRSAYPSMLGDAIVFMSIGCSVPLFEAKQLESAEAEYNRMMDNHGTAASMRLVSETTLSREKIPSEFWDWKYIPSIIPSDMRAQGALLTKDRDYEASNKQTVDRLFKKGILRSLNDGKCSYNALSIKFAEVDKKIAPSQGVSVDTPISALTAYKNKLDDLLACVKGEKTITDISTQFGVFFTVDERKFNAEVHESLSEPLRGVVIAFSRSMNIRRETKDTEQFFDELENKVKTVSGILDEIRASGRIAEQVAKGFMTGVFRTDGRVWQYFPSGDEPETLSNQLARYPLHKMYEKLTSMPDCKDILKDIENNADKVFESGQISPQYSIFKEQFKKEFRKMNTDEEISDSQKILMEKINEYISGLDV